MGSSGNCSKLVSLLALAGGALAMPQTSNADIIVTDLSSTPKTVGYGGLSQYIFPNLPGTLQFGFIRTHFTIPITTSRSIYYRSVVGGKFGGAGLAGLESVANFAVPRALGATWNGVVAADVYIGTAHAYRAFSTTLFSAHQPNSYGESYLAWKFEDTTAGNQLRYGWIKVSLDNDDLSVSTGPNVTILGYAYDDTGAIIPMGALPVPEPQPVALLALGALALGAKGLRNWRRNRTSSAAS